MDLAELEDLLETDVSAKTVTIDISAADADIDTVVIPVDMAQAVAEQASSAGKALNGMEIVMPDNTVTFDAAALAAIVEQAKEDSVMLHVSEVAVEELTSPQQAALAGTAENAIVVEVTLRSGNTAISEFGGGSAEIRLPYAPRADEYTDTITVWFVSQEGEMEEIPCRYEAGYVVFSVRHFSNYFVKPGAVSGGTDTTPQPYITPSPPPDDGGDEEAAHCFICGWFGRSVSPWCRVIPLLIILALVGACCAAVIRRRKKR